MIEVITMLAVLALGCGIPLLAGIWLMQRNQFMAGGACWCFLVVMAAMAAGGF